MTDLDTFKAMLDRAGVKYRERDEAGIVVLTINDGCRAWSVATFINGKLASLEGECW